MKKVEMSASALFAIPLTESQKRSLRELAAMPDSEIDYSDAPQLEVAPAELFVGPVLPEYQ